MVHGAIDVAPVHVCLGACEPAPIHTARFAAPAPYLPLPSGEQQLLLRGTDRERNFSIPLALEGGERRTVLVWQGQGTAAYTTLLSDRVERIPAGQAALRPLHAVHDAGALEVFVGGVSIGSAVPGAAGAAYGFAAAGSPELLVRDSQGGTVRYAGRVTLQPQGCYTLLLTGAADYLVLTSLYDDCSAQS